MTKMSEADVATVGTALRHLLLAGDHLRSSLAAQIHVNVTELTALGHLVESDELTPKQLAHLLGITTGSVTGLVDHLEAVGLLLRTPNPVDRRSILVRVTPAGDSAMRRVYARYHAALAGALAGGAPITPPELAELFELASDALTSAALATPGVVGQDRTSLVTNRP